MIELRQHDPRYLPTLIDETQISIASATCNTVEGAYGIDFCLRGDTSSRHIAYCSAESALADYERIKKALGVS